MTLNGVMAVTLRYFTEFGKYAFRKAYITAASICGGMHESIVFCSTCTNDVVVQKVHVRYLIS